MTSVKKKLNLLEKAEIADVVDAKHYNVSQTSRFFNITVSCARSIHENLHALLSLDRQDQNLLKRFKLSSTSTKYFESDMYMRERIMKLREKHVPVSYEVIKGIAFEFYFMPRKISIQL